MTFRTPSLVFSSLLLAGCALPSIQPAPTPLVESCFFAQTEHGRYCQVPELEITIGEDNAIVSSSSGHQMEYAVRFIEDACGLEHGVILVPGQTSDDPDAWHIMHLVEDWYMTSRPVHADCGQNVVAALEK